MWRSTSELEQKHSEVLAFHPEWISEDFNPKGIRSGFLSGDGTFISAMWNDTFDSYENNDTFFPTHFIDVYFVTITNE